MESAAEKRAREHFERDFAQHQMTVLHDEGLYRHLRFCQPGTIVYGYDLVTWPYHLSIEGDLDSGITFRRVEDMFNFFASGDSINPSYWSEKITNRAAMDATRRYSEEVMRERVREEIRDMAESEEVEPDVIAAAWAEQTQYTDLSIEAGAHQAIEEFNYTGRRFMDAWEWDLKEWDHPFLLCCHAIRAGILAYRERS